MSIDSLVFLFLFLPLALAIYYLGNDKAKEYILLCISLIFYALGSPENIIIFVILIVATVIIGRLMALVYTAKCLKTLLLITGIALNVSVLFFYKYINFAVSILSYVFKIGFSQRTIWLPLGISFFTFKAISYLIDTYNNKAVLDSNPIHDALYLSFFAQVQSGPLSRYSEMKYIQTNFKDDFSYGIYRFMIGFCKKIIISGSLARVSTEVFAAPFESFSLSYAWLGSICFSLQLFFDFSGYSDMAIGISRLFGYKCRENFNYPYITDSVSRFWRRWHISLSEWFRDYIYIPLGGSRNSNKSRVYFNLFVVWLLTGIWHGANWNFIAWGLGYFVMISFEKLTGCPDKINSMIGKAIYRVITLLFINFQWVMFNSSNLISGLRYIKRMFVCAPNVLSDTRALFLLQNYAFFIGIAILLSTPIVPFLENRLSERKKSSCIFELTKLIVVFSAFIWAISFIVAGENNPFLYGNF